MKWITTSPTPRSPPATRPLSRSLGSAARRSVQGRRRRAKFYREGVYVNGAAQGYLIDKKTAEQYHITNVEQLKDPKIAKLFDTNGDGKADLTGCTPGWGCEAVINHHIKAYGLSNTVEHNQGNYAAMIADTITRYKEGKPVLYYTGRRTGSAM